MAHVVGEASLSGRSLHASMCTCTYATEREHTLLMGWA